MPFKRFVAKKKLLTRRKTVKKTYKRTSVPRMALKILERKKREVSGTELLKNTVGGWHTDASHMTLTQGNGISNFQGHFIRGKGISFRGWFKNNADKPVLVRFGIMKIRNGAIDYVNFEAGNNVLEDDNSNISITTADSNNRILGRWNQDKYKPIKTRVIKLGANQTSDATDIHRFNFWIPLKGQSFRYDGSNVLPQQNVYSFFAVQSLANNDENIISPDVIEITYRNTFYFVDN